MARQRFIWPDIWTDERVARMAPVEMLFFIGCFSNADDEGRLMGDPAYLKATIFPYQDLTLEEVEAIRDRVVKNCRNLRKYTVNRVTYLAFSSWERWQKPKYPAPSKLPKPPGRKPKQTAQPSQKSSGKHSGNPFRKPSGRTSGNVPGGPPPWVGKGFNQYQYQPYLGDLGETAIKQLDPSSFDANDDLDPSDPVHRLLAVLPDRDERTERVLRAAGAGLPEAAWATARDEVVRRGVGAGYAVQMLRRIRASETNREGM